MGVKDLQRRMILAPTPGSGSAEAQKTGATIFFAGEAHLRTDAELRVKWLQRGEPALVDSTSPSYGVRASYYSEVCLESGEVEWMDASAGSAGGEQQSGRLGCLSGPVERKAHGVSDSCLGQRPGPPGRGDAGVPADT